MPNPNDLLKAWQDAIGEVGGAAASLVSGPAGVAGDLLAPLQRQAEQLERVLQRQLEFEREVLGRAAAPARAALEIFEQTTVALQAQAKAFRAAAASFSQVADLISSHAAPGDCLMVDNTVPWRPGPIRALLATRPAAFRSLVDVERGAYGPKVGWLWDGHVAVWLTTAKINKCTTIWTITDHDT